MFPLLCFQKKLSKKEKHSVFHTHQRDCLTSLLPFGTSLFVTDVDSKQTKQKYQSKNDEEKKLPFKHELRLIRMLAAWYRRLNQSPRFDHISFDVCLL